jgi:hypothetical protein
LWHFERDLSDPKYLLVVDLLGFRNIVRNLDENQLRARVDGWINLVDEGAQSAEISDLQLISDTLFVAEVGNEQGLRKLLAFSRVLLNAGVRLALPIRGAITLGECSWGRLIHGKAVIDAHELEAAQNWVGIACHPSVAHTENLWGFGSLIVYPAPLKNGPIMLRPVVDWEVPTAPQLAECLTRDGLSHSGEARTWEWLEKLNNTIQFRMYKELIKRAKLDPRIFLGLTSLEAIEQVLSGITTVEVVGQASTSSSPLSGNRR